MGAPPQLTVEERRAALAKAAESRKIRAQFKAEIKSGQRHWLEAFASADEAIKKMRVRELFQSIPGFGEIRAAAILERAGISSARRVQGVGRSQYENLLKILKEDDRR
jgi:ERCC4-type nuclease